MNIYSLIPFSINLLIVGKVVYDLMAVQIGLMSRSQMAEINSLYDNLLFIAIVSSLAALFLQDKRIKIASVVVGAVAVILIMANERTFIPEFNTSPVNVESGWNSSD
jgi:hypothetical protein